jgi:hypothetical protein
MAAPITHIVLAKKVFRKHFSSKNRAEFFVGTSLPDIRYFDNLDRDKTHSSNLRLEDIKQESSFMAGFKFHSLVDEVHNKFFPLKDNPLFREPIEITAISLKFFEDELFYGCLSDWEGISIFFDSLLEEELKYNDRSDILAWHQSLKKYFLQAPSFESRRDFLRTSNFSDERAKEIENFVEQMKKMPQVKELAQEFYDNFEDLI